MSKLQKSNLKVFKLWFGTIFWFQEIPMSSCMEEVDEDWWSIPVFRRPSSRTLLRRRTIFVRGGVSPPGSWPAGGHSAVTWPGSPFRRRSWSRRVWWRCPIITSSLNWKKKSKKSKKNSSNHMVSWQHINQDFFSGTGCGGHF